MKNFGRLLQLLILLAPSAALAAVEGRVVTPSGEAVDNARIETPEEEPLAITDGTGRFTLGELEAPALLLVRHPSFEDGVLEIPAGGVIDPLEIVLQPRQEFYEEIAVSAGGPKTGFVPLGGAATAIQPVDSGTPPANLTDAVVEIAGVSENGQGGIFQVVSIRGVSRQRVTTLISDMRIVGERRAGVSTSFVDPQLMGGIDVLRGPSSTYYGSGALGGVMQIFPRIFEGSWASAGYDSNGDENYQAFGWGQNGWSLGIARRSADDGEAPDGTQLHTGFDQVSAVLQRSWTVGDRTYEILAMPSVGRDIAKASSEFPDTRIVDYPEENHLLLRFGVSSEKGWSLSAYVHPNDLETLTVRPGRSRTLVSNEAFDLGLAWRQESSLGPTTSLRYGIDYFGRRGVTSEEVAVDLRTNGDPTFQTTLDEGEQDEASGYGALRWTWGKATLEAGGRFTWLRQQNAVEASLDRNDWSGFAGLSVPLGKGFELVANVGSGLRFASLSERFFSGTTGRGEVLGNPDLDPERSLNTDMGLRWFGKKVFLSGFVFRNEIDDYIERVDVSPGLRTFVNLTSGTLEGFELEGFYRIGDSLRLSWSGHAIDGESGGGMPLADVPPDELRLGALWTPADWSFDLSLALRDGKDDPGSGEVAIPSANLLSATVERQVGPDWSISVGGRNLLDETYFRSADDVAPLAPGRSLQLGLRWHPASAARP